MEEKDLIKMIALIHLNMGLFIGLNIYINENN